MALHCLAERSRIFCCEHEVIAQLGFLPEDSYVARDGLVAIRDLSSFIEHHPQSYFSISFRLRGGKGGFGTLLRSFRINKSSNQLMCRDLTGRRLNDVEEEKKLKKWVETASEREKEKIEKEKAKYEKLKSATRDKPKHDFNDPDYIKTREDILDKTDDAFDSGFQHLRKNKRKKPIKKDESSSESDGEDRPGPSSRIHKPKRRRTSEVSTESDDKRADANDNSSLSYDGRAEELVADPESVSEIKEEVQADKECPTHIVEMEKNEKPVEIKIEKPKYEKKEDIPKDFPPVDLEKFNSVHELEALGLHHLKHALESRGLKCGGSLEERSSRLYSLKGLAPVDYPKAIIAPIPKKK